jgi:hypothetical protein
MASQPQSALHRTPGFAVRSALKAGRSVCYQEVNGVWYPIYDPNNPFPPTPVSPNPAPEPGVQWLSCKSCTGTQVSPGQLATAKCEVCYL